MKLETKTRILYKFSELSEEAQQTALEKQAEFESQDFDYSCLYDDFEQIAEILGVSFNKSKGEPQIYWSGFGYQGDGLYFCGTYQYAPGASKKIREYAPQDAELHRIADELQKAQRTYFYQLYASISGHRPYNGPKIEVSDNRDEWRDVTADCEEALSDFCYWMFKALEAEYDYRTSAEACQESIEANNYDFDESGHLA